MKYKNGRKTIHSKNIITFTSRIRDSIYYLVVFELFINIFSNDNPVMRDSIINDLTVNDAPSCGIIDMTRGKH